MRLFNFLRGKKDKENTEGTFQSADTTRPVVRDDLHLHDYRYGLGYKNQSYRFEEDDDEDASSEVTLQPPPNPYHVETEPRRHRGPRSFAGEDLSSNKAHRRSIIDRRHDSSFRSEFIGRDEKSNNRMLKEINNNNKSVGWAADTRFSRAKTPKVNRYSKGPYLDDDLFDEREWMTIRLKQYERKCIELTQRLEEAINCHRKEKQRRKWYQSKLEEQTESFQVENKNLKTRIQQLDNELNYFRLVSKKDELMANDHLSMGNTINTTPVSVNGRAGKHMYLRDVQMGASEKIVGYKNLHAINSMVNGSFVTTKTAGQSVFDAGLRDVQIGSTSAGPNQNLLLLGKGDIVPSYAIAPENMQEDEVKNFRSQHTNSFSGSSRPDTAENLEMRALKAEIAAEISVGSSLDTGETSSIRSNIGELSPPNTSPEIRRGGDLNDSNFSNSFPPIDQDDLIALYSEANEAEQSTQQDDGYATSENGHVVTPNDGDSDEKSISRVSTPQLQPETIPI